MTIASPIQNAELFVGLIAPIGVNLTLVSQALQKGFTSVGYNSELIRLTDNIAGNKSDEEGLFDKYVSLIKSGNELRSNSVADVFSYLAIQEIF